MLLNFNVVQSFDVRIFWALTSRKENFCFPLTLFLFVCIVFHEEVYDLLHALPWRLLWLLYQAIFMGIADISFLFFCIFYKTSLGVVRWNLSFLRRALCNIILLLQILAHLAMSRSFYVNLHCLFLQGKSRAHGVIALGVHPPPRRKEKDSFI